MNGKRGNNLVVIENGRLDVYPLDNKLMWKIGRAAEGLRPDILLHSSTVSRKHGTLMNQDGSWFYIDENGKNGTAYNGKHITKGIGGRHKPIMLESGDVLIFGGGSEGAVNARTVWSMYYEKLLEEPWRVEDTGSLKKLTFTAGKESAELDEPVMGTVVDLDEGLAVYMGDVTYLTGDMKVIGS